MTKFNLFFSIILFSCLLLKADTKQECFLLMAGKKATLSGDVLLAHNNDLTGKEASMLIRIAGTDTLNTIDYDRLNFDETSDMLVLQTFLGYAEGDAVAINQHSVSVAGGLSLKKDRSAQAEKVDPLIKTGLGGGVRIYALRHAKTARECVEIIGKCYDTYGISYPSGVGVADTNEIWYLEGGGGGSWAAVKIPDSAYFVGANSYRIGEIDLTDTVHYLFSANLKELAEDENSFNFAEFFGGGVKEKEGNNHYNTRRIWRTLSKFSSSRNFQAEDELFPLYLKPDNKISLKDCFDILRDYYQGTEYSVYENGALETKERAIAVWRAVHTSVISLTPGKPIDYGAVLWTGLSSPFMAIYIPVYYGNIKLPSSYTFAPEEYHPASAFWLFKQLGDLSKNNYPILLSDFFKGRKELENEILKKHEKNIQEATGMIPNERKVFLGNNTKKFSKDALEYVKEIIVKLKNAPSSIKASERKKD